MQGRDCHKCVETQTFSLFQIDCCASFAGKPRLLQLLSDGFSRFNFDCCFAAVSSGMLFGIFVITWHCGIFRQVHRFDRFKRIAFLLELIICCGDF